MYFSSSFKIIYDIKLLGSRPKNIGPFVKLLDVIEIKH